MKLTLLAAHARPLLLVAALLPPSVGCAPSGDPAGAAAADAADTSDADTRGDTASSPDGGAATCTAGQTLPSGACCADGRFVPIDGEECSPVGPPSCAAFVGSGVPCVPRWCRAAGACEPGEPCVGFATPCTEADPGCPAGEWPVPWRAGACEPAGGPAPGAPPGTPRWCETHGVGGLCSDPAGGCPAGQVPTTEGCVEAGPSWVCPPGFVEAPGGDDLPACAPDPSDCAPWAEEPGAIHVKAGHVGPADGSFGKPYATVLEAVDAAPSGATIVVAPGEYHGSLLLERPVTIRGVCAASVTLIGEIDLPVVYVGAPSLPGTTTLRGLTLRDTPATGPKVYSQGIGVNGPQTLHIERCHLDALTVVGLLVLGKTSHAELVESLVSGTTSIDPMTHHLSVAAFDGGHLSVVSTRITNGRHEGLVAATGSTVEARDVLIDHARKGLPEVLYTGHGLQVSSGATATVEKLRVAWCEGVAIDVNALGSRLVLRDARVDHAVPSQTGMGAGLAVVTGAELDGAGLHLASNIGAGLIVGDDSTARVAGLLIEDTEPSDMGQSGYGVLAFGGASVELLATRVARATEAGVVADGTKTRLIGRDVTVDETRVDLAHSGRGGGVAATGGVGGGASAQNGATVALQGGRLSGNHTFGLAASQGARVTAEGVLIDGTQQSAGAAGVGAAALGPTTSLALEGCHIAGNQEAGLFVGGGSRTDCTGLLIEGTLQGNLNPLGSGVVATDDAEAHVTASIIRDNAIGGVYFTRGGSGGLERCVVSGATGGEYESHGVTLELGDGIVVDASPEVEIRDSVVADNARAGIFVVSGGVIDVRGTASVRNLYGVVVDAQELFSSAGNVVFGNAIQDFIGSGSLQVPDAPELALPELPVQ